MALAVAVCVSGVAYAGDGDCRWARQTFEGYLANCLIIDGCATKALAQRTYDRMCGPGTVLAPRPMAPARAESIAAGRAVFVEAVTQGRAMYAACTAEPGVDCTDTLATARAVVLTSYAELDADGVAMLSAVVPGLPSPAPPLAPAREANNPGDAADSARTTMRAALDQRALDALLLDSLPPSWSTTLDPSSAPADRTVRVTASPAAPARTQPGSQPILVRPIVAEPSPANNEPAARTCAPLVPLSGTRCLRQTGVEQTQRTDATTRRQFGFSNSCDRDVAIDYTRADGSTGVGIATAGGAATVVCDSDATCPVSYRGRCLAR